MKAQGTVFKYGDNVDTDVIIPARYLNSSDPTLDRVFCMEDIDKDFVSKVEKGDIIVANKNLAAVPPENTRLWPSKRPASAVSSPTVERCVFTGTPSISDFRLSSVRRRQRPSKTEIRWKWISTAESSMTEPKEPSIKDRRSLSSCRKLSAPRAWSITSTASIKNR